MQNAAIAKLKLNWRYIACDVDPENLREAIAGAKAMKFIGWRAQSKKSSIQRWKISS